MQHKFCLDTNVLWNEKWWDAVRRDILNKFLEYWKILIPEIVLEELEQKQIRKFNDEKDKFKKFKISKLITSNIDTYDIQKNILELKNKLISNNKIEIIKLENYEILPNMKDLAILKKPPFEEADNTDKWFKDCYIFFTLKEYKNNNNDVDIFLCTNDDKLNQASENTDIKTIKDLDDYLKRFWFSDYQRQSIASIFSTNPENVSCSAIENNINENKVLWITVKDNNWEEFNYRFEIDNWEIVDYMNENSVLWSDFSVNDTIDDFINSWSFQQTHLWIARLDCIKQYLLNDEIIKILNAAITNTQISQIISDDDVFNFILLIYNSKENILSDDLKEKYQKIISDISAAKDMDELPF